MKCSDVEDLIDAFVWWKLPKRQLSQIRSHLDECPYCRKAEQDYRKLHGQLKKLAPAKCPDGVVENIYRQAGLKANRSWYDFGFSFLLRNRFQAAFAAAAVTALMVGIWWQPEQDLPHAYTQKEIRIAYSQVKDALGRIGHISGKTRSIIEEDILLGEVLVPLSSGLNQALKPILNGDQL